MEAPCNESLKQQFQTLQDQQQKKLQRRKQLQEEKTNKSVRSGSSGSLPFGVEDDLDLKLTDPSKETSYLSEELVDHLNNQIRELIDENGRLYKLLSERDFEIRQLKKKKEVQKQPIAAGVTNETAATKIVELSKRVRELTAELESEKTKSKQLGKKCHEIQTKLLDAGPLSERKGKKTDIGHSRSLTKEEEDRGFDEAELKALQDKLRQSEYKGTEFRNQCLSLRQELKIAQKVLNQEIGENVNFQALLNVNSTWRGRAQQILTLQKKVSELRSKFESQSVDDLSLEEEMMGTKTYRKPSADDRHKKQLRKLEKERKDTQERAAAEFQTLEQDHLSLKQKLDASKARNKVISNEVKALKQQKQTLLDKGHHDDELITALMQQLHQLKSLLDNSNQHEKEKGEKQQEKLKELSMKTQQDNNIVEQLKHIASEKESKVRILEEEIYQLKLNHIQRNQFEAVDSLFEEPFTQGDNSHVTSVNDVMVQSITPPHSRLSERAQSSLSQISQHIQETARAGSRRSNRPLSSGLLSERRSMTDLQNDCQEFQTLAQVTAVEKDKLTEFVQVLQKRLEESVKQLNESQSELIQHRKRSVQLEKQLGKAQIKLEQINTNKTVTKKKSNTSLTSARGVNNLDDSDPLDSNAMEELQISLSIEKDENEALKAALDSTLKAKEEDLRMYTEMMEETKKVFLQALRQQRQATDR